MAKLYKKIVGGVTFACYSERGIVAYFMFRVLPTDPAGFLRQIVDGAGARPFASVQADQITNLTIFSELVFGSKYGFGNPDGGLYFEISSTPHLILYEAKINETYQRSCKARSYNSTIRGQLELRWRLVTLYQQGNVQTRKGVKYILEIDEFKATYSDKDPFYDPSAEPEDLAAEESDPSEEEQEAIAQEADPGLASYRHLALKEGVKKLFDEYVSKCDSERVYFLTSTSDSQNPFTDPATSLPRCHGKTWEQVRHRFCWISNAVVERCAAV